jgi:hypothetical protein
MSRKVKCKYCGKLVTSRGKAQHVLREHASWFVRGEKGKLNEAITAKIARQDIAGN